MTDFIPVYGSITPVIKGNSVPFRSRGYVFGDDFSREGITPTGWPTIYTAAETGAGGSTALDSGPNRVILTTDANAGDDQTVRTSGLRIDRNYTSLVAGMTQVGMQTSSVQIDLPFSLTSVADVESFVGIHASTAALTALPTTARHMGVYFDKSAGDNWMLTAADGTTQTTVDTTVAATTAIFILRILWTGEDAATLQLLTAAGATSGTGQTVAAFNGASGASHEIVWFVQTETTAAKVMRVYPYRVYWS